METVLVKTSEQLLTTSREEDNQECLSSNIDSLQKLLGLTGLKQF